MCVPHCIPIHTLKGEEYRVEREEVEGEREEEERRGKGEEEICKWKEKREEKRKGV